MALSFTASPRAWQWILEKLVDNKDVGTPIVKGLAGYVPDIEEPECRPLVRRMALRYLEEAIGKNIIDVTAIPLVDSACSFELENSSCRDVIAQKMRDRKLLLRVKIEAVISCVRQTQPDWSAFLETLNEVFPPEDLSPENQTQRNELLSVFKSKDVHSIPLDASLRRDLFIFVQQKQKMLNKPVLDELANSYVKTLSASNGRTSGGREDLHAVRSPDADFINNAKAMLGLGPATTSDPHRRPEVMQKQMCVESKEDGAELRETPQDHEVKVGANVRTRGVEGIGHGTEACNGASPTVSVQSDALTEIVYFRKQQGRGPVDQRKRRRESLDSDDATHAIGDGGAARFHSGCRARMNGNSCATPLKRMTGKCYECSMGGSLLFCDSCKASYHHECLAQQLTCNWTCPDCGKICTVPASKLLLPPPPLGKLNGTVREPSASGAAALTDCRASLEPLVHSGDVYAAHGSASPVQKNVGGCSSTEPTLLGSQTKESEGITINGRNSRLQETTNAAQMGVKGFSDTRSGGYEKNGKGSSVGKRACSSDDDDDDVQILESISCKRPKVINLEEDFKTADLKTITALHSAEHCPLQPTRGDLTGDAVAVEHAVEQPSAEAVVEDPTEQVERLIIERKQTASSSEPGDREAESCHDGEELDVVDLEMKNLTEVQYLCRAQDGHEELCHLCGDAGTMVSCETCPIAMHKSCLGPDQSSVDESGKWLCPYCVRKKAVQALVQAREAAKLARKQLLDAEKALAALKDRPLPRQEQRQRPEGLSAAGPHSSPGVASKEVELTKVPPMEQTEGENGKVSPGATGCKTTAGSEEHQAVSEAGGDAPSPVCGASSGGESPKGDERHDGELDPTSRTSKAHRKLSSGRKAVPGLRRKALPWTTEEEQVLREGVARFSKDGTWGFQWQRILEFGAGKFDKSRTGVDLKDKWRNMQRRAGSPSLR